MHRFGQQRAEQAMAGVIGRLGLFRQAAKVVRQCSRWRTACARWASLAASQEVTLPGKGAYQSMRVPLSFGWGSPDSRRPAAAGEDAGFPAAAARRRRPVARFRLKPAHHPNCHCVRRVSPRHRTLSCSAKRIKVHDTPQAEPPNGQGQPEKRPSLALAAHFANRHSENFAIWACL